MRALILTRRQSAMATTLEARPAFRSLFPMQSREQKTDIDSFARRHIGPNDDEIGEILREIGFEHLDLLIDPPFPKHSQLPRPFTLPAAKAQPTPRPTLRPIRN